MKLKIISYNIWHGHHLDGVISFLRQENADVIQLQEVASSGQGMKQKDVNIYQQLLDSFPEYKGNYFRTIWRSGSEGKYDMGQATFIKKSIGEVSFENHFYYRELGEFEGSWEEINEIIPRGYIQAKIYTLPGIDFFNIHFVWTKGGEASSHQQAIARDLIAGLKNTDIILTGDFNVPYGNDTYKIFADSFNDASLPKKPTLHPIIHPAGHKKFHIDYIMYRGSRLRHLSTRIPVVDASDHLPVVAEFEILSP